MLNVRLRVVVAAAVVFAVAATGAGWKWSGSKGPRKHGAGETHRIAGWTWDSGMVAADTA